MLAAQQKKLRDEELKQLKVNILENLPNLNKRQIRRHRIPYHEAIILELTEDGFEETAAFLDALIKYQQEEFEKGGIEAIILNKPMLKNEKEILDRLDEGLRAAETGIKNDKKTEEIDKLLETAIHFSNENENWWWIAEQIFSQCVDSVKDYFEDGGKRNAIVRYIYGRFLLKQLNDLHRAKDHLIIAREIAIGQNWTATEALKKHQGNLFKEICELLCELLITLSKEQLKTDPREAYKLCQLAQKRAIEAENPSGEAESLFQQGLCEMELKLPAKALTKFNKVLIMYFSTNNKPGICEVRIQLALAHAKLDNITEAKYHLHTLLEYTKKHDMPFQLALGHRCLGEMYLSQNIGQEASIHLLEALNRFHELEDYDNREQSKTFAAIASGMQLMLPYLKLINACDKSHMFYYNNLLKLVHWKDSRAEFWEEGDETDLKYLAKYMEMYGEFAKPSQSLIDFSVHFSRSHSDHKTDSIYMPHMSVSQTSEPKNEDNEKDIIV